MSYPIPDVMKTEISKNEAASNFGTIWYGNPETINIPDRNGFQNRGEQIKNLLNPFDQKLNTYYVTLQDMFTTLVDVKISHAIGESYLFQLGNQELQNTHFTVGIKYGFIFFK